MVTSSLPDKLAGRRCAVDEDEAVVLILVNESYRRKRGFLMTLFMFGLSWWNAAGKIPDKVRLNKHFRSRRAHISIKKKEMSKNEEQSRNKSAMTLIIANHYVWFLLKLISSTGSCVTFTGSQSYLNWIFWYFWRRVVSVPALYSVFSISASVQRNSSESLHGGWDIHCRRWVYLFNAIHQIFGKKWHQQHQNTVLI